MDEKFEVLVVTNDYEETFNLEKVPQENTDLVKAQKKQLSAELDLRRLVVNLDNTSTLLYISYNALSGTRVQSKVSGLQKRLLDLCAKSQVAMRDIGSNSSIVLAQLPIIYKLLVQGKAPEAMKILAKCSQYAGKMAATSEELAIGFEKMGDDVQAALEGSQDLYASDLKKKEELHQQIQEMRAKQQKLVAKSREIQDSIEEVNTEYQNAQVREERADKKATAMGIVNICASVLTVGMSTLAQMMKNQTDGAQSQKDLAEEAVQANSSLDKAQKTTSELFKMKMDMQKENREIAGEMVEIAELLKTQEGAMISTDKAVEMLKLAIRCLGNIVVAFTEVALFWRNIEQSCNNLKDGAFMTQVETFSTFDQDLQLTFFGSKDFKKTIIVYMATWVALYSISEDYYAAFVAIGGKGRNYIRNNLFEEDAYREASRLADEIIESMQMEQTAIEENNATIERLRTKM